MSHGISDYNKYLGITLRSLRKKMDLTTKELSELSGVSISFINDIEHGKKIPSPKKAVALVGPLGISLNEFFGAEVEEIKDEVDAIKSILNSSGLKRFPFEEFKIKRERILRLLQENPKETVTLFKILQRIANDYDIHLGKDLYQNLLRFQQALSNHYIPKLEEKIKLVRKKMNWDVRPTYQDLCKTLKEKFNLTIDTKKLTRDPYLCHLRSVLKDDRHLMINNKLTMPQKSFILARELGFRYLGLDERATTSPALDLINYKQTYNNYLASYFGGGILLPEDNLKRDLEEFFSKQAFKSQNLQKMINKYKVSPETFFYRITQIIPEYFGINEIHFLKFYLDTNWREGFSVEEKNEKSRMTYPIRLVKHLNMSNIRIPQGVGLNEHFCRKWLAVNIMEDVDNLTPGKIIIRSQCSKFLDEDGLYFCISAAYSLALKKGIFSSVSIGFKITDKATNVIKFLDNPDQYREKLGHTCERCGLTEGDCEVRAWVGYLYEINKRVEKQRKRKSLL